MSRTLALFLALLVADAALVGALDAAPATFAGRQATRVLCTTASVEKSCTYEDLHDGAGEHDGQHNTTGSPLTTRGITSAPHRVPLATGGRSPSPGVAPDILNPEHLRASAPRHLHNHHQVLPSGDSVTTNNTAKSVEQGGFTLLPSARDDDDNKEEVSLSDSLCSSHLFLLNLSL